MTDKFKAGDRVLFTTLTPSIWWVKPGTTGTVLGVGMYQDTFKVRVDEAFHRGSRTTIHTARPEHLELIPTVTHAAAAKTFIISLRKPDGSFAPADKPRTYPSRIRAEAVAQDMAGRHGGDFVVFEAVALASRPVPVIPPVTLTAL